MGYYEILNIVPVLYSRSLLLFYTQYSVSINPKFQIYPSPPFPFGNHKFVFHVCEAISVL